MSVCVCLLSRATDECVQGGNGGNVCFCLVFLHAPLCVMDVFVAFCARGSRWSVNYFFYNKQLKKLAFFACWIKSKFRGREDDEMRFLPLPRHPQPLDPSPCAPDSSRVCVRFSHSLTPLCPRLHAL